jgi:hypothetical protein
MIVGDAFVDIAHLALGIADVCEGGGVFLIPDRRERVERVLVIAGKGEGAALLDQILVFEEARLLADLLGLVVDHAFLALDGIAPAAATAGAKSGHASGSRERQAESNNARRGVAGKKRFPDHLILRVGTPR